MEEEGESVVDSNTGPGRDEVDAEASSNSRLPQASQGCGCDTNHSGPNRHRCLDAVDEDYYQLHYDTIVRRVQALNKDCGRVNEHSGIQEGIYPWREGGVLKSHPKTLGMRRSKRRAGMRKRVCH
ncbi:hypothetical protein CRENBAI_008726 [Crenichthys baileyi]|uniref:Uncharacterized protein n=1 Tax=Crenichthys baileyi TaxID=28760 RepID=A0AAV9RMY3_9TELE